MQDLAFLPLGSGGIAQSGWAVTLCFPTGIRQILAGTWSSGARLHPPPGPAIAMALGLPPPTHRRAQPSHHAGTPCPCIPQPVLLPTHLLCAPSLLGTPQGSPCLPMPHHGRTPTRAGSPPNAIQTIAFLQDTGSPKTLPALLRGSRLHGVPPTTSGLQAGSGLGGSEGVTVAGEARGPWHPSWPKPLLLFLSRPGARRGGLSPAQSPALAAGDGDGGGAPPLQVGLIFFFHCIIIITMLCVFDFSIKPSAQPCWLRGGWQGTCVTTGALGLSPAQHPQKITWGDAVKVAWVLSWR